ncbi:MAG: toxin TcdB middle/C-terminal domain-containing protein, partial [Wenzhouxiangellaceae bacterium]
SSRVLFSDLAAPGATTLTRVREGQIELWPSYGNGRLGPKVALGFDATPITAWRADNVMFADVTGSGYSDMLYIEQHQAHLYQNLSGNGFAKPVSFTIPAAVQSLRQVSFGNFHGKGAAAMLLSDPERPDVVRLCDFTGDTPVWRVSGVRNYTGLEQRIAYRGSVIYSIKDRLRGQPWITTPPFSSALVALIETRDLVSKTRTAKSFHYRDGYYDKVERVFRGYGMVATCDTSLLYDGQVTQRDAAGAEIDPAYFAPPLLTKTWRNVGAYPMTREWLSAQARQFWTGYADEYSMPANHIDWQDNPRDAETLRQAYVAQAGTIERVEIYGLDGSIRQSIPYNVTQNNWTVRVDQSRGTARYGSFFVHPRESISYQFEQAADDPRIAQTYALEYDLYGAQTRGGEVAYKRRGSTDLEGQKKTYVYADRAQIHNQRDDQQNLLGMQLSGRQYHLVDVAPPAADGYYSFAQMQAIVIDALGAAPHGTAQAELIAGEAWHYQAGPDDIGLAPQALLIQTNRAAFHGAWITALFAPVLSTEALNDTLREGGYEYDQVEDLWWVPGNRQQFGGASEFYLNTGHTTPFGAVETRTFDDTLSYVRLGSIRAAEVVTQEVTVSRFDFNHMQPTRRVDSNNRVSEEALDVLGLTFAGSYYGYEAGVPAGFGPIDAAVWPIPPNLAAVIHDPRAYLQDAAEFYDYDMFSMMGRVSEADFSAVSGDVARLWDALVAHGYLTAEGGVLRYFRALGGYEDMRVPPAFASQQQLIYNIIFDARHDVPVHALRVSAWEYPGGIQR